MQKESIKSWLFFLAVLLIPVTAFSLYRWYRQEVADLPYFREGMPVTGDAGGISAIPLFDFVDQDGLPLNNESVKGKIWVAHYFFISCPTICPAMIANMKSVQQAYLKAEDLMIISITADPKHDDVHALKKYATAKQIFAPQWQLATGDKKALYQFARKGLYIVATDANGSANDFIHSDRLVLVDQQSRIRGYYNGLDKSDVYELINDIQRLKNQGPAAHLSNKMYSDEK